ncbi:TlyA family RNA methyltransferase [Parvibaculaceae bacterium PLY_AMNH_Bact1]|nr:TlyA family RNA methyltransferase [Parvibaculaceae bacterium PLY_AMNH_Bact1]
MTVRLDRALVERGFMPTRARAQAAIKAGRVRIDGATASKASQSVGANASLSIDGSGNQWVSRAALKLVGALEAYPLSQEGLIALDVGASTGGFTQVLLANGAAKVYAVDVGHGQLAPEIAEDARVISLEKTNAKDLTTDLITDSIDLIVSDVSFIGLEKALPAPLSLARVGSQLIALIKPQFEVGPGKVGKGGIVKDTGLHAEVCKRIQRWLENEMGWMVKGLIDSPIKGSDGNKEFLIYAEKS